MKRKFLATASAVAVVMFALTGCTGATTPNPTVSPEPTKTFTPKPTKTPTAPPVVEPAPEPEPYINRIILNADTLVTMDSEGNVVDEVNFETGTPQDVVNAVVPALGGPNITYQGEENVCSYDLSTYTWDDLYMIFPGKDASTDKFFYMVTDTDSSDKEVVIQSAQGAKIGDSHSEYIKTHPQVVSDIPYTHEGITYTRSLDEHTVKFSYSPESYEAAGVILNSKNDEIYSIITPWFFYGDC